MQEINVRGTYLIATIALFVASVCLLGVVTSALSETTLITLGVSALVAGVLLNYERRRDSLALALYAACVLPFVALVAGIIWRQADAGPSQIAVATLAVSVAGFVACVAFVIRERRKTDVVPNVLLQRVSPASVFESEGVQWAFAQGSSDLRRPSTIQVLLQNCIDAPRRVRIRLTEESGTLRRRGGVRLPPIGDVELAAGEVVAVTVPVSAGARESRCVDVYIELRASGPAGERLRVFRGRIASTRVSVVMQILGAFAGYFLWGGGVSVSFANTEPVADDHPLTAPTRETLWSMPPRDLLPPTSPGS